MSYKKQYESLSLHLYSRTLAIFHLAAKEIHIHWVIWLFGYNEMDLFSTKQMLKPVDKKIFIILHSNILFMWTYEHVCLLVYKQHL